MRYCLLFTLAFLSSPICVQAQEWSFRLLDYPAGGMVTGLVQTDNGTLYAGIGRAGFYRSADDGDTWSKYLNFGEDYAPVYAYNDGQIIAKPQDRNGPLIVVSSARAHLREEAFDVGADTGIRDIDAMGSLLFGLHRDHIFRTIDTFRTATSVGPDSSIFHALVISNSTVWVLGQSWSHEGQPYWLARSHDSGATWERLNVDSVDYSTRIAEHAHGIVLLTNTTNRLEIWEHEADRARIVDDSASGDVLDTRESMIVLTGGSVGTTPVSSDSVLLLGVQTWTHDDNEAFLVRDGEVVAVRSDEPGFVKSVNGEIWTHRLIQGAANIRDFDRSPSGRFLACTDELRPIGTEDVQKPWRRFNTPELPAHSVQIDAVGRQWALVGRGLLVYSTNGGNWWRRVDSTGSTFSPDGLDVKSFVVLPDETIVVNSANGLFTSNDLGLSWVRRRNEVKGASFSYANDSIVLVSEENSIRQSTDRGSTWDDILLLSYGVDSAVTASSVARDGTVLAGIRGAGSTCWYKSPGSNRWDSAAMPRCKSGVLSFLTTDERLFAVTEFGFYDSFDNGESWRHVGSVPAGIETAILAEGREGEIYLATEQGLYLGSRVASIPSSRKSPTHMNLQ